MFDLNNAPAEVKKAYVHATTVAHKEAAAATGGQDCNTPGYFVAFWDNFWGPYHAFLSRHKQPYQPA